MLKASSPWSLYGKRIHMVTANPELINEDSQIITCHKMYRHGNVIITLFNKMSYWAKIRMSMDEIKVWKIVGKGKTLFSSTDISQVGEIGRSKPTLVLWKSGLWLNCKIFMLSCSERCSRKHCFQIIHKSFYLLCSCEPNISGTTGDTFSKYGINIYLHSSMKWIDFNGQRSKVSMTSQNNLLTISQQ